MNTCQFCRKWLFREDVKKEMPEDSGMYACEECCENPCNEKECDCLYGCDYCLAVELRIGKN